MIRKSAFIALALLVSSQTQAVTIDFNTSLPSVITPSLNVGGVTITGSSNIFFFNTLGLGIEGGTSDTHVDSDEWINFSFDSGSALNISYTVTSINDDSGNGLFGERVVEAFAPGGNSIGGVGHIGLGTRDVSTVFGNVPIESFTIYAGVFLGGGIAGGINPSDQHRILDISFEPFAVVPVPATAWLFGSGLIGLIGIAKRKKM